MDFLVWGVFTSILRGCCGTSGDSGIANQDSVQNWWTCIQSMGYPRLVTEMKFSSIVWLPTCAPLRLSLTNLVIVFIALSQSLLVGFRRRVLRTAVSAASSVSVLLYRYAQLSTDPFYFFFLFVCLVCFALCAPSSGHLKQGHYRRRLPGFRPLGSAPRSFSGYSSRTKFAAEMKPFSRALRDKFLRYSIVLKHCK